MNAGSNLQICPIHNLDLEKAIGALPAVADIPHCFLQTLHRATFLCPVMNRDSNKCSDFKTDDSPEVLPYSENEKTFLVLFTSPNQTLFWPPSSSTGHVHLSLSEAVFLARSAKLKGLVLNPGSTRCMRVTHEAFDKILTVSPVVHSPSNQAPIENLEITQGMEMIISTPDPTPPKVFLSDLTRVLKSIPQVRDAFLFELAWGNTSGELVLGIVAESSPPADLFDKALDSLSSEARDAAKGFDHFDVMTLDDPAMIEVIKSTVSSLLTGEESL